jgi:hypothetical protein
MLNSRASVDFQPGILATGWWDVENERRFGF